ncbi:MAG: ATPase, T2SS/T4P/T4SS family, partial [Burkholderiales bacterium]
MATVSSPSKTTTAGLSGLARALVQQGKLANSEAEAIQEQASAAGVSIVTQLIQSKKLTALEIAEFASSNLGLPLLNLAAIDVLDLPTAIIGAKLMREHRIVGLRERANRIFLAISDPTNLAALDGVKFQTGLTVEPIVVEDDKLAALIAKLIEATDTSLTLQSAEDIDLEFSEENEEGRDADSAVAEVDDAPVVKYLQKILLDAIHSGVSDVHFEPYEKEYRIRYRLDGELVTVATPPLAIKDKLASRIKVISRMDISEKRVPQDGRMKLVLSKSKAIDFRVSSLPTLFGEKICMRILDPSSATLGIDALGYEPIERERLLGAISRPYGMI